LEQLSRFLVAGLCFVVLLLAPLVAAPLARFLKLGRQALDDKICWEGPRQEEVEDRITYTATFLVSVLAGILAGAVYVWYVHNFVLVTLDWLNPLLDRLPWINFWGLDYLSSVVIAYWVAMFCGAFAVGWTKTKRGGP
jgi:hypothetical protein